MQQHRYLKRYRKYGFLGSYDPPILERPSKVTEEIQRRNRMMGNPPPNVIGADFLTRMGITIKPIWHEVFE